MPTTDTEQHPTDQLEQVETELARRAQPLFDQGLWRDGRMMERGAAVIDYTRRCLLPDATEHYRMEKSCRLVEMALELSVAACEDWCPDDDARLALLEAITDHRSRITKALTSTLVAQARPDDRGLYRSDVDELAKETQALTRFVEKLQALNLPERSYD